MPFPKVTTDNYLRKASKDIINILIATPIPATPSLEAGDETRNGLLKLASLLITAEKLPNPKPITEHIQPQRVPNKEHATIPAAQRVKAKKFRFHKTKLEERGKSIATKALSSGQVNQTTSKTLQQMYYLHTKIYSTHKPYIMQLEGNKV